MFIIIYIVCALVFTFFALSFFSYGLVHGGSAAFVIVLICVILSVFLIPLYLYRRFRERWKYSYLVYLVPALIIVFPIIYFFAVKPQIEKQIAIGVLKEIVITPLSEELIKSEKGGTLGIKFTYRTSIPRDIDRLTGLNSAMSYFIIPQPEVSYKSGGGASLLRGRYSETKKDGVKYDMYASPGIVPGEYITDVWLMPTDTNRMDGRVCRSKFFNESRRSSVDYTELPQVVVPTFTTRVSFSNRMGMYDFSHQVTYEFKNQISGPEVLSAVLGLEECPRDY